MKRIVVLGANGAMGSGSAAVFAAAGIPTAMLARTRDKAEAGRARAEQMAKRPLPLLTAATYDDLDVVGGDADLIFEAVAEDIVTKRELLARIDRVRRGDTVVATVSSGLSIAELCASMSDGLRRNFLGIHLFNPPTAIVGCEIVPHAETDPAVVARVRDFLTESLGREVIETADTPAFAGNRVGFKVLNEVAQLAEVHGVAFMDQLVGAHTGRALAPLATIDLVGWDVHQAIVDNLHANTRDEAHDRFRLPAYMRRGIAAGHLGRKTRDKGGFFRVDGKGADAQRFVLDPATGAYRPLAEVAAPPPPFVGAMTAAIEAKRPEQAMDILCTADGDAADLLRRIVLGYISYALCRVGEVVRHARDIDRIMGFGFCWAPPSVLVDAIGARRTIELLERAGLPVPGVVIAAADGQCLLFDDPAVDSGRFFVVAA
jgi:3-hydroxyacyl-CoA dehydrogenase